MKLPDGFLPILWKTTNKQYGMQAGIGSSVIFFSAPNLTGTEYAVEMIPLVNFTADVAKSRTAYASVSFEANKTYKFHLYGQSSKNYFKLYGPDGSYIRNFSVNNSDGTPVWVTGGALKNITLT